MNNKVEQQVSKKRYKGFPLEDATEPLLLSPIQEDFDSAVPGDPERCVFANFIKRTSKVKLVEVHRTTAYVLDPKRKIVLRYKVRAQANAAIQEFDEKTMQEWLGGVYVFDAPSPSQRLGYKKKYNLREPVIQRPAQPRKSISRGSNGNWRLGIGKVRTS